jgi:3-methyladenine DNA glycosylase/8-oxoguanine DNA glycosylase
MNITLKELFVCAAEGCIFLAQPRVVNTICHAICSQQNGIATANDYD